MAGYRWQYVNLDDCIVRYHNHGSSGKKDLEYLTFDLLKCIGKEYKPLFAINRDYSQFVILCYVFHTYQFITYQLPTCSAYREKNSFTIWKVQTSISMFCSTIIVNIHTLARTITKFVRGLTVFLQNISHTWRYDEQIGLRTLVDKVVFRSLQNSTMVNIFEKKSSH